MKTISKNNMGSNIDPETTRELNAINAQCLYEVTHVMKQKLIRHVVNEASLETAERILKSSKSTEDAKRKIKMLVAKGILKKEVTEEINEEFERQMNICLTAKIEKAKKQGRLKPPKDDPLARRMRQRILKT